MAVTVADAASELADAAAAGLADVMATMDVVSLTAALDAAAAEGWQVAWRREAARDDRREAQRRAAAGPGSSSMSLPSPSPATATATATSSNGTRRRRRGWDGHEAETEAAVPDDHRTPRPGGDNGSSFVAAALDMEAADARRPADGMTVARRCAAWWRRRSPGDDRLEAQRQLLHHEPVAARR